MLKQWSRYIGIFGAVFLGFGFISILVFALMGSAFGSALFGLLMAQMVAGIVGIAIFLVYSTRDAFSMAIRNKSTIFGIIGGIFLLGLLITANVASHTELGHMRFDTTKNKIHSLSKATRDTLSSLPQKIEIVGFLPSGNEQRAYLTDIADKYVRESDQVALQIIDPDQDPMALEEYGAASSEILVRNAATKKIKKLTGLTEQDITTAIRRVVSTDTKTIYFLQGHGEGALDQDQVANSLSFAKIYLENEGYQVKPLNLSTQTEVPNDANIIVAFGATRTLPDTEVKALQDYLKRGGSLVLGQDPIVSPTKDKLVATGWEPLLEEYGLEFKNNILLEYQVALLRGKVINLQLTVTDYLDHPITKALTAQHVSEFSVAQPVYQLGTYQGSAKRTALFNTSENSWAETNIGSIFKTRKPSPTNDKKGPLPLAQIAEWKISKDLKEKISDEGKLVVFGDADFATNQRFQSGYNRDVFLNVFNYLGGEERQTSIRPKTWTTSTMELSDTQRNFVVYSSLFFVPQLIVLLGMMLWVYRRNRS